MLKNTAKYALITSLIIILQLLIVLLIVSEYNPLYRWFYDPVLWQFLALPLALFLVSAAIGFIVALLVRKKKAAPVDEVQAAKQKKVRFFWSIQFFTSLLLSLIVLGFSIQASPEAYLDMYADRGATILMLMLLGMLLSGVALAAIATAVASIWHTNKTTSYILGLTAAIPLAAVVFGTLMVRSYSANDSHARNSRDPYYIEETSVYNGGDNEEVEDYVIAVSDAEALLNDEESEEMSNVIKYFIHVRLPLANEKSDVFYVLQHWWYVPSGEDFESSQLSYFYDSNEWDSKQEFMQTAQDFRTLQEYLTGDANELLSAFQRYFPQIKSSFPKSDYKNSAAAVLVKCLLATHDDLYADSNTSSNRLQGIYDTMTENEKEWDVTEYYSLILPYTSDVISKKRILADADNDWLVQQVSVWAYSFWARRYQEGTDEAALTMLNMITNYYKAN